MIPPAFAGRRFSDFTPEEVIEDCWRAYHLGSATALVLIPAASAIALVAAGILSAPILFPTIGFALLAASVPLTLAFIDPSDNIFN